MGNSIISKKMSFTITYSDKHYPSSGVQPVANVPQSLHDKLNKWSEANPPTDADLSQAAGDVLDVLYYNDFSGSGKHWDYDGCSCYLQPCTDPDVHLYSCEISHTWDWKDIYSVAKATASISINWKERTIFVEGYSYYCSG